MADETGKEQSKTTWPLLKFAFKVKIGDTEMLFQEVAGLNSETQVIEYRAGTSKTFLTGKIPGIKKYENITLKRGILKSDAALEEMINQVQTNTFERKTVTISLLDEQSKVAMSWTLINAFPCKITAPDMNANGNDVAVETLELAHEGLALVGGD